MLGLLGSVAAPGYGVWYACRTLLKFSRWPSSLLAAVGAFSGALGYLRVLIQDGYLLDYRCRARAELSDKVVVVTGTTVGGLGHEAAKLLAAMGATLVVTVRSASKGATAIAELGPKASYVVLDFTSAASIREGAQAILGRHDRIDVLVSNAGIGGVSEPADTWMANHVGPSLLISLLRPTIEATARAHGGVRLVFVSSSSHRDGDIDYERPYERVKANPGDEVAYKQSKLAQICYMRALQGRLRAAPGLGGESAVRCVAVSPGVAFTNIMAFIPGPFRPLCWVLFRSPYMGAQVIKMAAVDESVVGGSYLTNCHVVRSAGKDDCSNKPEEWERVWALTTECMGDGRYP